MGKRIKPGEMAHLYSVLVAPDEDEAFIKAMDKLIEKHRGIELTWMGIEPKGY